MSQAGRTRSCRAPREISRSPRLAHKAPVMQANDTSASEVVRKGESNAAQLIADGVSAWSCREEQATTKF